MGRGGRSDAGHRGGKGTERHSIRGSRDTLWDPMNQEDDTLHDLRPHVDDQHDPVNDEYVWPEFTDEDED